MKFICTSLLVLCSLFSFCQIKKGDWLVNGDGSVITFEIDGRSPSTTIQLEVSLGYFFRDNWMIGGNVDLRSNRFAALTINELFARHYLKDTLFNARIYAEARWIFQQSNPTSLSIGGRRFESNTAVLSLGLDRFISPQLAIEAQLEYHFFRRFIRAGQSSRLQEGFLTARLGIQYFFRYRDWKEEREKDYRNLLRKGTWTIGGRMSIADRIGEALFFEQNFNPFVALFVRRNWAVGSEFNYTASFSYSLITIGFTPFSRYYLNVGRKKKIFGELRTTYLRTFNRQGVNKYLKGDEWEYGLAVGLSNFINDNVSFDVSYIFFKNTVRTNNFDFSRESQRQGFNFAMHYFFIKKKS